MAMRLALKRSGEASKVGSSLNLQRCVHAIAQQPPFGSMMSPSAHPSPPMVLPEDDYNNHNNVGPFIDGSLEPMAVPKQRISRHKRGIRNGPKFLKPAPVIIRCTVCGRVKLPHFYCCSGIKEENGGVISSL